MSLLVTCEPDHNPVLLCKNTEVRVMPKDLYMSNQSQHECNASHEINKASYLQFQNLRITPTYRQSDENSDEDELNKLSDSETHSITSYFSFISPWLYGSREKKVSEDVDFREYSGEFYQFNFDSILRVLPYTNSGSTLPLVIQSTTVFISASTYVANCGDKEIPPCFVAVLQKFPLPIKRRKGAHDSGVNGSRDGYQSDSSSHIKHDTKVTKDSDMNKSQKLFESVCVTVMVMKSAEEDEFKLPLTLYTYKNAIVVPKQLKRAFNFEVASLVHLKSVDLKPLPISRIVLHPVTDLVSFIYIFY